MIKENILVASVLILILAFTGCSLSGNECDKLAKVICKDERFKELKKINGKKDSEPLLLTDNMVGRYSRSRDECGRAETLARISREADTPFARDTAVSTCQTANLGLSTLLQMVPDR